MNSKSDYCIIFLKNNLTYKSIFYQKLNLLKLKLVKLGENNGD